MLKMNPLTKILLMSLLFCGSRTFGSLIMRPSNIAGVEGSRDITMKCSSSLGTNAVIWIFTPSDSTSKTTLARGTFVTPSYSQTYSIADPNSNASNLVIHQLSDITAGTYVCTENNDYAVAFLISLSSSFSIQPLFGPIAGGTNITMTGFEANKLPNYVAGQTRNLNIGAAFIGYRPAANFSLSMLDSSHFTLVLTTPDAYNILIKEELPIIIYLLYSSYAHDLTFIAKFTYRKNPEITGFYPKEFITTGGTILNVTGHNLTSVAKPVIQVMIKIIRANDSRPTSTLSTETCIVPDGDGNEMICPVPPINLPNDFQDILDARYNITIGRRKRDIILQRAAKENIYKISTWYQLQRRRIQDTNVLTIEVKTPGDRAEIYLGFILDGYKKYENINEALPDSKITLYSAPEIQPYGQVIEFDPRQEELIYIKGKYMLRGCRITDYAVKIGKQTCETIYLQDNQLSCRPPSYKPNAENSTNIYCQQSLDVKIIIGYKVYQYACLEYKTMSTRIPLIVGLTVGLALFILLIFIVFVWIAACLRRRKPNSAQTQMDVIQHYDNDVNMSPSREIRQKEHVDAVNPEFVVNDAYFEPTISTNDGYLEPSLSTNDGYLEPSLSTNDGYLEPSLSTNDGYLIPAV